MREVCTRIDPNNDPYDVALDTFEKGMTTARLDEIFDQVTTLLYTTVLTTRKTTYATLQQAKAQLIPLLAALRAAPSAPDGAWLYRKQGETPFDTAAQAALCNQLAVDLGFDLDNGRLDVSVHPFTGGAHPTDVRMTTRYKPHDFMEGITGAIHETGHALYERGRNLKFYGLPVNEVC